MVIFIVTSFDRDLLVFIGGQEEGQTKDDDRGVMTQTNYIRLDFFSHPSKEFIISGVLIMFKRGEIRDSKNRTYLPTSEHEILPYENTQLCDESKFSGDRLKRVLNPSRTVTRIVEDICFLRRGK